MTFLLPPSNQPRRTRSLPELVIGVVVVTATFGTFVQLFGTSTVLMLIQEAIATTAVVILGFELCAAISFRMRGHAKNPKTRKIVRRALGLQSIVLLGIAAAGFLLTPAARLLMVFALGFCAVGRSRQRTKHRIHEVAEKTGFVEHETLLQRSRQFWEVVKERNSQAGARGTISYLLVYVRIPSWLGDWLEEATDFTARPLETTYGIVALLTGVACATCIAVSMGAVVARRIYPLPVNPTKPSVQPPRRGGAENKSDEGGHPLNMGDVLRTAAVARSVSDWASLCPSLPGLGAPGWFKRELNALYLGELELHANPPPGVEGGCTGRAVIPKSSHGMFVYTIGRNAENEIRSVAVDSLKFGPAIFLAPAAQRALALIEQNQGPVGGLPTITAANGDVTTVTTRWGSFTLVRAEKHEQGRPNVAMPYIELPPAVTNAWLSAMREFGWLWPLAPYRSGGVETFVFATDPSGSGSKVTVLYEAANRLALRGETPYHEPATEINERDLEHFASKAR